jgi:hypothetical protein
MSITQTQSIIQGELDPMGLSAFTPLEDTKILGSYGKKTSNGIYQITVLQSLSVAEMYIIQYQTPWTYAFWYLNSLESAQIAAQELRDGMRA